MKEFPQNYGDYGRSIVSFRSANKSIPEGLRAVFEAVEGKDGDEYVQAAYTAFVKYYNLEGVAPKELVFEESCGRPIVCDYRWYNNTVAVFRDQFKKVPKQFQIGIIARELTHMKQVVNIIRTDCPLSIYAHAHAVSDMRANLTRNPQAIAQYRTAQANGKEYTELMLKVQTQRNLEELSAAFAHVLKMSKHPVNSPAGIKAMQDIRAEYGYNGADMNSYNNCALEKEAQAVEKEINQQYAQHLKTR